MSFLKVSNLLLCGCLLLFVLLLPRARLKCGCFAHAHRQARQTRILFCGVNLRMRSAICQLTLPLLQTVVTWTTVTLTAPA